jgi:hypothetical protein
MVRARSVLLRMQNVSDIICRENQNIHFMFNNSFCLKIVPFVRQCEEILSSQTGHRWQFNMEDALCYRYTLRICDTYCSSMAMVVRKMRLTEHYMCIACLVLFYWGATSKFNMKLAENDNRYSFGGTALCVEWNWSYRCKQRYRIHICVFCMVDHMNLNNKEMRYKFNYTQVF